MENEEEMPKLIRQNFVAPKVVAIVSQLIIIVIIIFILNDYLKILNIDTTGTIFIEMLVVLMDVLAVLFFYLFTMLSRYMDNFEQYNDLKSNIKYLSFSFLSSLLLVPLTFVVDKTNSAWIWLLIIIIIALIISLCVSVANQLEEFEGDYVGGLNRVGYCMQFWSQIRLFKIFILPIAIFNVFNKAGKYAEIHGFIED
jgi:hypothetical protein